MKTLQSTLLIFLTIFTLSYSACARGTNNNDKRIKEKSTIKGLVLTPPMGWNSWNCFGTEVTEEQVKAVADYMAEHLKEYGWEYVVVDAGWYHPPTFKTP